MVTILLFIFTERPVAKSLPLFSFFKVNFFYSNDSEENKLKYILLENSNSSPTIQATTKLV